MFWEMYQQYSIHQADQKAGRAELKTEQMAAHIQLLEGRVESLALACQSLWELLRDSGGFAEEQLLQKMEEIDLRDGVKDGRMTPQIRSCQQCGRNISRRRKSCIYCGTKNEADEPFGLR